MPIEPGDILFDDFDGICVVPKAAEQEVFARALEKVRAEKTVGKALDEGMTARRFRQIRNPVSTLVDWRWRHVMNFSQLRALLALQEPSSLARVGEQLPPFCLSLLLANSAAATGCYDYSFILQTTGGGVPVVVWPGLS